MLTVCGSYLLILRYSLSPWMLRILPVLFVLCIQESFSGLVTIPCPTILLEIITHIYFLVQFCYVLFTRLLFKLKIFTLGLIISFDFVILGPVEHWAAVGLLQGPE